MEGEFTISYTDLGNTSAEKTVGAAWQNNGEIVLDFGYITNITISINKALSTIPLVSMGSDRAFQLETGSTLTYNIDFKRKNPENHNDLSKNSAEWSNAYWYMRVTRFADRWQMKTNGCRARYKPLITNPYVPAFDVNCYLKTLTRKYSNTYNEIIEGRLQLIVGTMYVLSTPTPNTLDNVKTYRAVILKSNISGTDASRYTLEDVVYSIETDEGTIQLPETPSAWEEYKLNTNKKVSTWSSSSIVTDTHTASAGGAVVITPGNNALVLTANWSGI